MDFISELYSLASKDGKVILRACVDRPLNSAHNAFNYLNEYSGSIRDYVNGRLFSKALEVYDGAQRDNVRFVPFLYAFKCSATYSDDIYYSCVMTAKLSQAATLISQSLDTVVFCKDQILPPGLINRAYKKKMLAIDAAGFPCVVDLQEGKIILQRAGKCIISK